MRFTQSISEKVKIAPVIHNIVDKVIYTEPEIDELQQSVFNQFKKGDDVQHVMYRLCELVVWILIQPLRHINCSNRVHDVCQ